MKKIMITLTVLLGFISCKKGTFQCECKNSNTTYLAGEVEATKRKAEKHCKSLSSGATDCYLK